MSASNSPVPTNTNTDTEPKHWLLRVGDGENFISSSNRKIWGISSKKDDSKYFIKNAKPGDKLWFVKSKSQGKVIAVATFTSCESRVLGPLVDISPTDEELGWTGSGSEWEKCDTEVHYTDLYGLNDCDLLTRISSPLTIRKYNEKCQVNLPLEYSYIVRYSKVITDGI
jgi:hypothetical protein